MYGSMQSFLLLIRICLLYGVEQDYHHLMLRVTVFFSETVKQVKRKYAEKKICMYISQLLSVTYYFPNGIWHLANGSF